MNEGGRGSGVPSPIRVQRSRKLRPGRGSARQENSEGRKEKREKGGL